MPDQTRTAPPEPPAPLPSPAVPGLATPRGEIDRIDDAPHHLLMRRAELARPWRDVIARSLARQGGFSVGVARASAATGLALHRLPRREMPNSMALAEVGASPRPAARLEALPFARPKILGAHAEPEMEDNAR